jgi:hypothetical protein
MTRRGLPANGEQKRGMNLMAANATNGTDANSANDAYISLLKQALTASIYDESAWKIVQPATLSQNRKPWHAAWYAQRWERLSAALQGLSLQAARRKTAAKGLIKVRKTPMDHQRRAEGRDWLLFGYTMVGLKRLDNIQACVDDVIAKGIPGDRNRGLARRLDHIHARAFASPCGNGPRGLGCRFL